MSGRASRYAIAIIAFIGLGMASYLTYVHYSGELVLCTSDACETVQTSAYSKLAGVPVALLGLIGYLLILSSVLIAEREQTRLATLCLTAVGFGFSLYLTGREVFSIHAICEWCVSSAGLMTLLMLLAVWRFLSGGEDAHSGAGPPEEDLAAGGGASARGDGLGAGAR